MSEELHAIEQDTLSSVTDSLEQRLDKVLLNLDDPFNTMMTLFDVVMDEIERVFDPLYNKEEAMQLYQSLQAGDMNQDGVLSGKEELLETLRHTMKGDSPLSQLLKKFAIEECQHAHAGSLEARESLAAVLDGIELSFAEKHLAEAIDRGKGVEPLAQRMKIDVFRRLFEELEALEDAIHDLASEFTPAQMDELADKITHRIHSMAEKAVDKTVSLLSEHQDLREEAKKIPVAGVIPKISWQEVCKAAQEEEGEIHR